MVLIQATANHNYVQFLVFCKVCQTISCLNTTLLHATHPCLFRRRHIAGSYCVYKCIPSVPLILPHTHDLKLKNT